MNSFQVEDEGDSCVRFVNVFKSSCDLLEDGLTSIRRGASSSPRSCLLGLGSGTGGLTKFPWASKLIASPFSKGTSDGWG